MGKQACEQAMLLDVPADMDPCGPQGSAGLYTAERARAHRPEACRIAVEMLAGGSSLRSVIRVTKLHPYTIRALQGVESETFETLKGRAKVALSHFVAMGTERMMEEMESMDLDKLPIAVAVAIDKLQLLSGGATERVEHIVAGRAPTTLEELLGDGNGFGGGTAGQTREAGAAGEPVVVLALPVAELEEQSSAEQGRVANEATSGATGDQDTGGGDRSIGAGAGGSLDTERGKF